MGYLILLILFLLLTWLVYKNFLKSELNGRDLLVGWALKLVYAFTFMYLISFVFGDNGKPMGDVGTFLSDSEILKEYGKKDPVGYTKLMFGINADNDQLLANELKDTKIWDYGITKDNLNDNRLIIRLNSLIHFFSFQNIWVHTLIFAFLSFIGIILIYRTFSEFVVRKKLFYLALLITPTFAFWGSGITKETLFVLSFGLFVFSFKKLLNELKLVHVLILTFSIIMLLVNKTHVGLIVIPISLFVIIHRWFSFNKKVFAISGGIILLALITLSFTPEKINLVDRLSSKQQDLINVAKGGVFFVNDSAFCAFDYDQLDHFDYIEATRKISVNQSTDGEYKLFGEKIFRPFTIDPDTTEYDVYLVMSPSETFVDVEPINHEPIQLVKNTPIALLNVLIRPLPNDNVQHFKYALFAENLIFCGFLILVLFKQRKIKDEERRWVFFTLVSAILLILVIGWSTPIIGAVIRYKMAPQLLLILAAFMLWKTPKKSAQ